MEGAEGGKGDKGDEDSSRKGPGTACTVCQRPGPGLPASVGHQSIPEVEEAVKVMCTREDCDDCNSYGSSEEGVLYGQGDDCGAPPYEVPCKGVGPRMPCKTPEISGSPKWEDGGELEQRPEGF